MQNSARRLIDMTDGDLRALIRDEMRAQAEPEREVLTRDQAAELLQVHPDILVRYVRQHGLPASKVGPEWRFRRSELLAWLNSKGLDPGEHPGHWSAKLRAVNRG